MGVLPLFQVGFSEGRYKIHILIYYKIYKGRYHQTKKQEMCIFATSDILQYSRH